jgi:hypothetical protein
LRRSHEGGVDCSGGRRLEFRDSKWVNFETTKRLSLTDFLGPDYNIPNDENSYLIIPFGDLEAGRQVITAVAVSFGAHNKIDIR